MAGGIEEEGVGLAGLEGQQEDAARIAHHGVDDVGAGNEHVAGVGIELHDRGLVRRQHDALRDRTVPGRDGDDMDIAVRRRRRGTSAVGEKTERGQREAEKDPTHCYSFLPLAPLGITPKRMTVTPLPSGPSSSFA